MTFLKEFILATLLALVQAKCPETSYTEWKPAFWLMNLGPNLTRPEFFQQFSGGDRHGCLRACSRHPLCLDFAYWENTQDCFLLWRLYSFDDANCLALRGDQFGLLHTYSSRNECVGAPMGYTYFEEIGSCLKLYLYPMSWEDARTRCQQERGDLAMAQNSRKLQILTAHYNVSADNLRWIGAQVVSGTPVWLDSSTFDLRWDDGTTNGDSCMSLNEQNSFLADSCDIQHNFICEIVRG